MNERDNWTVDAMEDMGGDFVKALGALARRADQINLIKIKIMWPGYWAEYEEIGRDKEKKANIDE